MFFWNKICVIWFFILICGTASAQLSLNPAIKIKDFILKNSVKDSFYLVHFAASQGADINRQKIIDRSIYNVIPQDYYTRNFGYFCKQELLVEKAIKIPLHFRLGSLQQCNYYEGKK